MTGRPQILYRVRDADGDLLYVGISMSIGVRVDAHSKTQPWWDKAAAIQLEHFATREDVEAAEIEAIRAENPRYNVLRYPSAPNGERTRTFDLEDWLWAKLGKAAERVGMDRAKVIRQFLRWYLHVPGAELPQRP